MNWRWTFLTASIAKWLWSFIYCRCCYCSLSLAASIKHFMWWAFCLQFVTCFFSVHFVLIWIFIFWRWSNMFFYIFIWSYETFVPQIRTSNLNYRGTCNNKYVQIRTTDKWETHRQRYTIQQCVLRMDRLIFAIGWFPNIIIKMHHSYRLYATLKNRSVMPQSGEPNQSCTLDAQTKIKFCRLLIYISLKCPTRPHKVKGATNN